MKRISFLRIATICAISTMLLVATDPKVNGDTVSLSTLQNDRSTRLHEAKLQEIKILSVNIRRVAQIFEQEGVPLQAGMLFTPNGREKIRAQLVPFPDMHLTKVHSEPLRGVVMADSLTLPESSTLEADTVIIANQVNFEGRAPTIKGAHDFHLFALGSVNVENGPGTVITIDTSGTTGLAGATGNDGTDGTNAGKQTIVFAGTNGGSFNIIAIGGSGGNGGDGGSSGDGGRGGTASRSGNGGNGGKAGTIVFSSPSNYVPSKGMNLRATGGSGGRGGGGGDRGAPGEPGRPGNSAAIASNTSDLRDGRDRTSSGYEPGITTEKCTQWFSGRSYIGCF